MTQPVAVPLWLLIVLVALAALAALQWLLLPGWRWMVRRSVRRVLDEIQLRLAIELPPFKLTRRQALIDRLESDPRVLAAAQQHALDSGEGTERVARRVHEYAQEIVPAFNAYVYFRVGYWLAKTFARAIYRVRLGDADQQALAAINPKSTVVFVMNHRSNMDYVLVSFLAAEKVALSYAVGEWARVWPLQGLIRAMGAYFVRRNSGDALYRMVLQRYVQMATEGGVPQAMYPEGGLSIDGRLREPLPALLDQVVFRFLPEAATRMTAFETGEVMVASEPPALDAIAAEEAGKGTLETFAQPGIPAIMMINTEKAPTDDINVRKAMILALNDEEFVQTAYQKLGIPSYSVLSPTTWSYDEQAASLYRYNPEEAARLLDEAGWKDSDGDGIRDKDGNQPAHTFDHQMVEVKGIKIGFYGLTTEDIDVSKLPVASNGTLSSIQLYLSFI